METEEQIGGEAAERAVSKTQAIADEAGASVRKACEVIALHLEEGSLKAADMTLKIHDGYPSEKREVTHKGRLDHVHHMTDEELNEALNELGDIEKADE